jgi:hypothetical protein
MVKRPARRDALLVDLALALALAALAIAIAAGIGVVGFFAALLALALLLWIGIEAGVRRAVRRVGESHRR